MSLVYENGLVSTTSGSDSFIYNDIILTGVAIWVDSVAGNNSNAGTEEAPLADLAHAITAATANNGDLIIIKSGHTEMVSSTITLSKAGVKIFGLGSGSSAPNFTVTAATDGLNVTGANVEINNLYFPAGTSATNTSRINVDAANVKIKGCTFVCGAKDQDTITLTANALYPRVISCAMSVTASGPRYGISVESASVSQLRLESCSFDGGTYNWSGGAVYSAVAHTFVYDTVTLTNRAHVIHTTTAKGYISNYIAGDNSQVRV